MCCYHISIGDLENVGGWKATKRQNLVAKLEGRYVGASWLLPSHTHNTHDSSKMWFPIHTQTHTHRVNKEKNVGKTHTQSHTVG